MSKLLMKFKPVRRSAFRFSVDGKPVKQKLLNGELVIETELEVGRHRLLVEVNTEWSSKWWFAAIFIMTLIGTAGSCPPDIEKGRIKNFVLECDFDIKDGEDTAVEVEFRDRDEDAYEISGSACDVLKNEGFYDKKLEKRRNIGKAIVIGTALAIVLPIIGLCIYLVVNKYAG
ncbi:MAG: hypothetical protein LBT55_07020 [Clostridiaceae bacterium]|jgi:hypothetical protein|nr:hypothetical protein [Clostridiaceae bacterium]